MPTPATPSTRRRRNSSRVNLLISAAFHGVIVILLTYFAAREGLLGKELRKIAVEMVREKPPEPEKPKEPEKKPEEIAKEEKPAEETPTPTPDNPPPVEVAKAPTVNNAAQSGTLAPPPIAPPAIDVPSFAFEGGRAVRTSSDPIELYRGLIEHSLRSRWERPADIADRYFVAEVDVEVDRKGALGASTWKKRSGHVQWDASVQAALAATRSVPRPPPTNFPGKVTIRFDVQEVVDALGE